ncbi:MAG TPA: hypothetical protein H9811_07315 [Candidatus Gemmiger excrementigallinarum]|uniref:Uncharacterized protein n=1 Tax=Candidatus Gemmiger excrementigallinarum TaxID=2838609 RepID=A0A9D2ESG2_9FIRM|nr:hypothetical protein [Candidatus Gemmiger excrementigallinarum]
MQENVVVFRVPYPGGAAVNLGFVGKIATGFRRMAQKAGAVFEQNFQESARKTTRRTGKKIKPTFSNIFA